MINLLLILSIFLFVPILGIPDQYDLYIYLAVLALLYFESLRLWKTKEVFRQRVNFIRSEVKKKIKSFFKEEEIPNEQNDEQSEETENTTDESKQ